jgi:predicted DNA-binding transcriptional regulator AlpA
MSEFNLPSRWLRRPAVCEMLGCSRTTFWRWVRDDASFPKARRLSVGIFVWPEHEVAQWRERRAASLARSPAPIMPTPRKACRRAA